MAIIKPLYEMRDWKEFGTDRYCFYIGPLHIHVNLKRVDIESENVIRYLNDFYTRFVAPGATEKISDYWLKNGVWLEEEDGEVSFTD